MISLTDRHLEIITQAAAALPVEKRSDYLQRIAAHLQIRCGRYTAADVAEAAQAALVSLTQHHHTAA